MANIHKYKHLNKENYLKKSISLDFWRRCW